MTRLYKSTLIATGVFLIGLLMYCLRHEAKLITLVHLAPLVLLYGIGIGVGFLLKPAVE